MTKKIHVGDNINADGARFRFSGKTPENFDAHIKKSVPLYDEGHKLVRYLSDFFFKEGSLCYEIGTSTGTQIIALAEHLDGLEGVRLVGIDIEQDMISQAINKLDALDIDTHVKFEVADALSYEFDPADMIILNYTLQFIHPSVRQTLIDKIYQSLNWGGALVLFEKVRASDARFQDIITACYNEFKLDEGFTPEEIFEKTRSLRGVMDPFSSQGNIDLLTRAGFQDINSVQKFLCFEGFLAIK